MKEITSPTLAWRRISRRDTFIELDLQVGEMLVGTAHGRWSCKMELLADPRGKLYPESKGAECRRGSCGSSDSVRTEPLRPQ